MSTAKASINVYKGELVLRVENEELTIDVFETKTLSIQPMKVYRIECTTEEPSEKKIEKNDD